MRATSLLRALAFLLVALTATTPAVFAQTVFTTETAVADGDAGRNPSLAIGPDGFPFIAYNDNSGYRVMLAHKSAAGWSTEEISIYAGFDPPRALALTPAGEPVVAFTYNQMARAGTRNGGTWTFEDYDAYAPWWQTLALDSHGEHHVAYSWSWGSGSYQGYLYYDRESIAVTAFIQTNCSISLAMDSADRPHLLFTPVEGAPMEYWSKPGFDWTHEVLPVGTWGVLAFDANDAPHIAYYDHAADDLVYGVRSPGGWFFEPIDTDGDVGRLPSLALGVTGSPHVSYYDATHGDLKYAAKKSGTWELVVVDATGNVGTSSSIALLDGETPAIAYFDATQLNLKYAVAATPVPSRPATLGSVKAMYRPKR